MAVLNKDLLSKIFPNYISLFEQINNNTLFQRYISTKSADCKVLPTKAKHDYFKFINDELLKNQPIDYLEFGVYEGGTITDWPKININKDSRFFAFDLFPPKYPVPKMDDARVTFIKGLFQDTLHDFLKNFNPRSKLVIFINLNKHHDALFCLSQLDPILTEGSLIMFDQFGNLQQEFIAFHNYLKSHKRDFRFVCQSESWRKATVELLSKIKMPKASSKLEKYDPISNSGLNDPKKKANVVFLLIDDFRADKCQGLQRTSHTPNLDLLVQKGVYFANAISSADGTFASMGSIFTSQYPHATGITWASNHSKAKKIFENFKIFGYDIHATVPNYDFFSTVTKNLEKENLDIHDTKMGLSDGVGDLILKRLESAKMKEPWFYYVHVMDLHLQRPTQSKFNSNIFGKTEYERKVSSVDNWIGKIIESIDLQKTLVVLASDHGEYVLDSKMRPDFIPAVQGRFLKNKKNIPKTIQPLGIAGFVILRKLLTPIRKARFEKKLDTVQIRSTYKRGKDYLYDEAVHVPLLFFGSGIKDAKIISNQVRHVDIFPTIADMIGFPINKKNLNGRSLLPLLQGKELEETPAIIESMPVLSKPIGDVIGVRTTKFKYYRSRENPKDKVTLFDLIKDPNETKNIAEFEPQIVEQLEKFLADSISNSPTVKITEELNKEKKIAAIKILKEMGYD